MPDWIITTEAADPLEVARIANDSAIDALSAYLLADELITTEAFDPRTGAHIFRTAGDQTYTVRPDTAAEAREVIGRAIELIGQGWTTETEARDAEGDPTEISGAAACQWCMRGAVIRAYNDHGAVAGTYDVLFEAIGAVIRGRVEPPEEDVFSEPPSAYWLMAQFNDKVATCRADVEQALREAIAHIEAA